MAKPKTAATSKEARATVRLKLLTPIESRRVDVSLKADQARWAALVAKPLNAWRPTK